MTNDVSSFSLDAIARRIFVIRGQRVMLDADLGVLYGVETHYIVRAAKVSRYVSRALVRLRQSFPAHHITPPDTDKRRIGF